MALISGISSVLCFLRRAFCRCSQRQRLLAFHTGNNDALPAAFFARNDSNSGPRHVQTLGKQLHKRLIRAIVHRRRGKANFQSVPVLAFDGVAARPPLYLPVKPPPPGAYCWFPFLPP